MGFANLAFAGGRDTIIHSVSCVLAHLSGHPESLDYLRADPRELSTRARNFSASLCP